jgi:predicted nucleic acid-binding protein
LIGEIQVLPALYERVIIPQKVFSELQRPNTPKSVKDFIASAPIWLDVRTLSSLPDPSLDDLDPGEREAITLALEINADALLI